MPESTPGRGAFVFRIIVASVILLSGIGASLLLIVQHEFIVAIIFFIVTAIVSVVLLITPAKVKGTAKILGGKFTGELKTIEAQTAKAPKVQKSPPRAQLEQKKVKGALEARVIEPPPEP